MGVSIDGVRLVLRALAEARDGPFYLLWIELVHRIRHPLPKISFRMLQVAHSGDIILGVWVGGTRSDGIEVEWSIGVQTAPSELLVSAAVSITDAQGDHEVFSLSRAATDAEQAAQLIREYGQRVCDQREWLEVSSGDTQ